MLAFLALDCQGDAGPVVWIRGLTGAGDWFSGNAPEVPRPVSPPGEGR